MLWQPSRFNAGRSTSFQYVKKGVTDKRIVQSRTGIPMPWINFWNPTRYSYWFNISFCHNIRLRESALVSKGWKIFGKRKKGSWNCAHSTSKIPSTSTAAPWGNEAVATANRACLPESPKISTIKSEAPFKIVGGWIKSGVALTKPPSSVSYTHLTLPTILLE